MSYSQQLRARFAGIQPGRKPLPSTAVAPFTGERPKTAPQSLGVVEVLSETTRQFTGVPCYQCGNSFTIEANLQARIVEDIDCPNCGYKGILKKDLV